MRYRIYIFLFLAVIVSSFLVSLSFASAGERCLNAAGKLVSAQGVVQLLRDGETGWNPVNHNESFCSGDKLRVQRGGRAAVVLANESILRINQNSTINFGKSSKDRFSVLNLLKGAVHIFSHRPRSLKVVTPYINGTVEGTEFVVNTDERVSSITVFEGRITAVNDQGQLDVRSGQSVHAEEGTAPQYMHVVRPWDAVAWTLYYPSVIDKKSIDTSAGAGDPVGEAARMLKVGRVNEARELLAELVQKEEKNSDALALLSIIDVAWNKKEQALTRAMRAWALSPGAPAAALALSYARQAYFDINGALRVLQEADSKNPDNGEIKSRLSELLLSTGELEKGVDVAGEAVRIDPMIGRAHSVLGFAHLARIETDMARKAFQKAIQLDPVLPLARLGLGLAMIRDGELEQGRSEIEIAVALDPRNSLIRSYLGKAYFDEKRESNSRRQYDRAKELDPLDPTPWFYDAIRKQSENRPVEALSDLQKSITLNNNRAVYRSRLLLDSDLAARSASLGRIYADIGFQQLAMVEGWKSVNSDPANYSAHRLQADTFSALPRHEVARVSELLQSQLLQPLNLTPIQPQLAESSIFSLESGGAAGSSFNEFNPLFLRNRLALQGSVIAGSNNTFGDELVHSAVQNKISYSIGQLYYQTDGTRLNNDQEQQIYSGFVQGMISPATSIMVEFRHKKNDYGDLSFRFDPAAFSRTIRQEDKTSSVRIGGRHDLRPFSTLIGTAIVSSDESDATGIQEFGMSIDLGSEADNVMVELQHLYKTENLRFQTGAGYISADEKASVHLGGPVDLLTEKESRAEHMNMYGYGQFDLTDQVTATLGLSGDHLDSPVKNRDELNPKLGVTWQPFETTLVRGAFFKAMHRRLIYAQTVEPTQVAGFNQFFDDFESATSWTYGAGVDQKLSSGWYGGMQLYLRNLDVPFSSVDMTGNTNTVEDEWQEQIGSIYLYWVPSNWATLGVEYYYEKYEHDQWEGPKGIQNLTTHRVVPKINFFHSSGLNGGIQISYIDQTGDFGSTPLGFVEDSDQFWVVDLSLSYRLPKHYGMLRLEVKNLFDEEFKYLDTDPASARFLPEMQIMGRLTVAF